MSKEKVSAASAITALMEEYPNYEVKAAFVNKYRNKITVYDGIRFASKKEAKRYTELKLLAQLGAIQALELQVPFVLIPKQPGERECKYIADFVYTDNGERIVEDCKGKKTREYIIKRKLMRWVHGITILET